MLANLNKEDGMSRTESISIQTHPDDEQEQINLMQMFHWNLLSSQEIKTLDSGLERRGDTIYSVTKSENYVKLVFQRELNTPNLDKIKELEDEYFSLDYPNSPGLKWSLITIGIGLIVGFSASQVPVNVFGVLILAGGAYWLVKTIKKRNKVSEIYLSNDKRREDILAEVEKL